MAKYRKKPVVIEAITFNELVQLGIASGATLHGGMPWSFIYQGQPVTHENDDCYLVPTHQGTVRFERGDMLITQIDGEIYPCKPDIFAATYDPLEEHTNQAQDHEEATPMLTPGKRQALLLISDAEDNQLEMQVTFTPKVDNDSPAHQLVAKFIENCGMEKA